MADGTNGANAQPNDGATEANPNDGAAIEPQPSAQGQPNDGATEPQGEGVTDKHGQPGINKERHDKEVGELNKKIADLTAKLDESAKTEKAREALKKEIDGVRAEIEAERTAWKLEKAGCRNVKLASKALDDYEGDVEKLKAECPYLFDEDKPKGATGAKPGGAPDDKAARKAKAWEAAGLPPEK